MNEKDLGHNEVIITSLRNILREMSEQSGNGSITIHGTFMLPGGNTATVAIILTGSEGNIFDKNNLTVN